MCIAHYMRLCHRRRRLRPESIPRRQAKQSTVGL
jgi:hypothetical protein